MKRVLAVALCLVALAAAGCGSTQQTCESINWEGRQCEALDQEELNRTMKQLEKELSK